MVYDNDVMAAAGLAVAAEEGVLVPEQLSLVAWDDSPLGRLAGPSGPPATTQHAQPPRLTLRGTTVAPLPRHTSGVS